MTEMTNKKDELEKEIEGYRQELDKYSNTVKMLQANIKANENKFLGFQKNFQVYKNKI
jgi:uncharacterized coiled-coil DUF342 family protein